MKSKKKGLYVEILYSINIPCSGQLLTSRRSTLISNWSIKSLPLKPRPRPTIDLSNWPIKSLPFKLFGLPLAHSICSSFELLADKPRDLSHPENKITQWESTLY